MVVGFICLFVYLLFFFIFILGGEGATNGVLVYVFMMVFLGRRALHFSRNY